MAVLSKHYGWNRLSALLFCLKGPATLETSTNNTAAGLTQSCLEYQSELSLKCDDTFKVQGNSTLLTKYFEGSYCFNSYLFFPSYICIMYMLVQERTQW